MHRGSHVQPLYDSAAAINRSRVDAGCTASRTSPSLRVEGDHRSLACSINCVGQIAVSWEQDRHNLSVIAIATGSEQLEKLASLLLHNAAQRRFCVYELANKDEDLLLWVCIKEKGLH